MHLKIKYNLSLCLIIIAFVLFGKDVLEVKAQSNIAFVERTTQDNQEILFLRGADLSKETLEQSSVYIGEYVCENVSFSHVSEDKIAVQTHILIDNSYSIPENIRSLIGDTLNDIVAARMQGEQFSVSVFDESVHELVPMTDDYVSLKNAIQNIQYQDQETYLTDALYDYCNNLNTEDKSAFTRIIVVSDGVDNKAIGYTKEELIRFFNEKNIPVYTVGIYNAKKSNSTEIKNMFSISRATWADSFLLEKGSNADGVLEMLSKDRNIWKVIVTPPTQVRDGSKKTITLQIGGQTVVIDNVRFMVDTNPQETEIEENESAIGFLLPEDISEIKDAQAKAKKQKIILFVGLFAFLCIITGIVLLIVSSMKKKKRKPEEKKTTDTFNSPKTEILGDNTEAITSFSREVKVILKDIRSDAHIITIPLVTEVVIGRDSGKSDICISNESTVSGEHCKLYLENDAVYIQDLNSSNGTFVNGSRIYNQGMEIGDGDTLKLGRLYLSVEIIR